MVCFKTITNVVCEYYQQGKVDERLLLELHCSSIVPLDIFVHLWVFFILFCSVFVPHSSTLWSLYCLHWLSFLLGMLLILIYCFHYLKQITHYIGKVDTRTKSIIQSVSQSVSLLTSQSINESMDQSTNQSMNQSNH